MFAGKYSSIGDRLLKGEGMETAEVAEMVTGAKQQPLYWLAFAARHKRALEFWEKIRNLQPALQISLLSWAGKVWVE